MSDIYDLIVEVTTPASCKSFRVLIMEIRVSFIPRTVVGVPVDEYKMVRRLDIHPIVSVPVGESTPASDRDKWTFDF